MIKQIIHSLAIALIALVSAAADIIPPLPAVQCYGVAPLRFQIRDDDLFKAFYGTEEVQERLRELFTGEEELGEELKQQVREVVAINMLSSHWASITQAYAGRGFPEQQEDKRVFRLPGDLAENVKLDSTTKTLKRLLFRSMTFKLTPIDAIIFVMGRLGLTTLIFQDVKGLDMAVLTSRQVPGVGILRLKEAGLTEFVVPYNFIDLEELSYASNPTLVKIDITTAIQAGWSMFDVKRIDLARPDLRNDLTEAQLGELFPTALIFWDAGVPYQPASELEELRWEKIAAIPLDETCRDDTFNGDEALVAFCRNLTVQGLLKKYAGPNKEEFVRGLFASSEEDVRDSYERYKKGVEGRTKVPPFELPRSVACRVRKIFHDQRA